MKYIACLTALLFVKTISFAQSVNEKQFSATLKAVVTALKNRDSATLVKYTDNKWGIYIIYRPGILDSYKQYPRLSFSDSTYPIIPFYDDVKLTTLRYAALPTHNCEGWSKTGTLLIPRSETICLLPLLEIWLNKSKGQYRQKQSRHCTRLKWPAAGWLLPPARRQT